MATIFSNVIQPDVLATGPTTLLEMPSNIKATVIGFNAANKTTQAVGVTITMTNTDTGASAILVKDMIIPPMTSFRFLDNKEKLILDFYSKLTIQSSRADSVDVVMSYVQVS